MIRKLNNKIIEVSKKIYSVFQVSYAVEAKLIKAIDFPPLKRTLDNFLYSETAFYGFWKDNELAAVIEIKSDAHTTLIQSLVVDPKYFRQGIAAQLITFIFDEYNSKVFNVETGAANKPAIQLYEKFGFKEIKQWDTNHGVRKVRFEKNIL